jgi:DNA (cytosine-5)-methyltransferase 1
MRWLDLFCGAGGATTGIVAGGDQVFLAMDNWTDAIESHKLNHLETEHIVADILNFDFSVLGRVDAIWGSPPCINFSVANSKKKPEDGMILVKKFLQIIDELRPKYWIMENVHGVGKFVPFLKQTFINSADFGVPQTRKRLFCGEFPVPLSTHTKWITVGEALKISNVIGEHSVSPPKNKSGFKQGYQIIDLNKPCRTVTDNHGNGPGFLFDNGKYRRCTIQECATLQGFPMGYKLFGTKLSQYKQIGNAVSPPVVTAIVKKIKETNCDSTNG